MRSRSKLRLLVLAVALVMASCSAHCPGGGVLPDPKNPYAVARAVVQGAQLALYGADALFNFWSSTCKDPAKVAATTAKYNMIRGAVAHGLSLVLRAVDIAEKMKTEIDLKALMKDAELAWQDLRALLETVLSPTPTTGPTSTPAPKVEKPAYRTPTLEDLPKTLLQ